MNGQTGFPRQEIRSLLLEYLSQHPQGQFSQAVQGVIDLAKKHGTYAGSKSNIQRMGGPSYDLDSHGYRVVPEAVRQLFWQFLVQGLLVWGSDDINPNLPFYRVADYGQSILKHESARPYGPDGFLKEFATTNSQADSVVLDYLEEAVRAFNSGCHKAAAVMLGCASEQLVLVLHEAFEEAIEDAGRREAFAKSYRWTVYSKFNSLRDGLNAMIEAGKLGGDLREAVRSDFVSGFELIRRFRNSAGHPELPLAMRRETIYLNLTVFPEYARQMLRLIEYFRSHTAEP